jgi:hypothetical protein
MSIFKVINTRGYYEQEKQYLFPALYGNKAVTRQTKGMYKHFHRELIKRKNLEFRTRFYQ